MDGRRKEEEMSLRASRSVLLSSFKAVGSSILLSIIVQTVSIQNLANEIKRTKNTKMNKENSNDFVESIRSFIASVSSSL